MGKNASPLISTTTFLFVKLINVKQNKRVHWWPNLNNQRTVFKFWFQVVAQITSCLIIQQKTITIKKIKYRHQPVTVSDIADFCCPSFHYCQSSYHQHNHSHPVRTIISVTTIVSYPVNATRNLKQCLHYSNYKPSFEWVERNQRKWIEKCWRKRDVRWWLVPISARC